MPWPGTETQCYPSAGKEQGRHKCSRSHHDKFQLASGDLGSRQLLELPQLPLETPHLEKPDHWANKFFQENFKTQGNATADVEVTLTGSVSC